MKKCSTNKAGVAFLGITIGWIFLLLFILYVGIAPSLLNADPRMETRDGFCHFQIDPYDDDDEVFAGVCASSIYVYPQSGDMADGDAIWKKEYNRGRTPIGVVELIKLQQQDHNTNFGDTGEPGEFILEPAFSLHGNSNNAIKRVRLTGETSNSLCRLVDSNGTVYRTEFWTAVYDLYEDGAVVYTLECRNARN